MTTAKKVPKDIDEYIAGFPDDVQTILEKLRQTILKAAPGAQEKISYQIPAFMLNGELVYFAAFKSHIGFYPPVTGGDEKFQLEKAVYEGPKGNLKFPFDKPIPYALIGKIVKLRVTENLQKSATKITKR